MHYRYRYVQGTRYQKLISVQADIIWWWFFIYKYKGQYKYQSATIQISQKRFVDTSVPCTGTTIPHTGKMVKYVPLIVSPPLLALQPFKLHRGERMQVDTIIVCEYTGRHSWLLLRSTSKEAPISQRKNENWTKKRLTAKFNGFWANSIVVQCATK